MKFPFAVLVLLALTITARGEGVQYTDEDLHCSIKLPEGWRRLSPRVAERAAQAAAIQTGRPVPNYQAWFQRSDKPEGAYPYLLVYHQICRTPTLDEIGAALKVKNPDPLNGTATILKISDPVIDIPGNRVFLETELDVHLNAAGKVFGRNCVFPGKRGVAALNFYTTADDKNRSKADFDFVLDSFAFEPGYGSEAGLTAKSPPAIDSSRAGISTLIGALLTPFIYAVLRLTNPKARPGVLPLRLLFTLFIVVGGLETLLDPPNGPASVTFDLGFIALGVIGHVVLWIAGRKKPVVSGAEVIAGSSPPV